MDLSSDEANADKQDPLCLVVTPEPLDSFMMYGGNGHEDNGAVTLKDKLSRPLFFSDLDCWLSFADVALVSAKDDDTEEYVHYEVNRAVLAGASDALLSILQLQEVEGVEVSLILTELPAGHLELFVHFVQTGCLDITMYNDSVKDSFLSLGVNLDELSLRKRPVDKAALDRDAEHVELRPFYTEAMSMLHAENTCQLATRQDRIICEEEVVDKVDQVTDTFLQQDTELMEEDWPFDNEATKGLVITADDFFPLKPVIRNASEANTRQRKREENLEKMKNIAIDKPTPRQALKTFFKCEFCPYVDTFTVDFVLHIRKMHKNTNPEHEFFCIFCEEGFKSDENRKTHEKVIHPDQRLICKYCNRKYCLANHGAYYRHVLLHCGTPNLHCIQCGQQFKRSIQYSHHRNQIGPFHSNECAQCPRGTVFFNSWTEHQKHLRDCHDGVFKVVCGTCAAMFPSKIQLRRHNIREHPGTRGRMCEICGEKVDKSLLKKHRYLQHNIGDRWVRMNGKSVPPSAEVKLKYTECEICGKVLHKRSLSTHMSKIHTNAKEEVDNPILPSDFHTFRRNDPCVICGKIQRTKHLYKNHFATKHLPEEMKPYHCRICNKGFGKKRGWEDHEQYHEDKKPHKCRFDNCSAAFKTAGNRNVHEKSVHGGFKRPKRERRTKKVQNILVKAIC